ncbi:MAG: hypothetical protein J0H14_03200 [Alphaproteobacteria bacterium]|nr:hypothetical protein [Alphaproteobacteria bacterium]
MSTATSDELVLEPKDVGAVFSFRPKPADQRRLLLVMDALRNRYGIAEPSRLDAVRLSLRLTAAQFAKSDAR